MFCENPQIKYVYNFWFLEEIKEESTTSCCPKDSWGKLEVKGYEPKVSQANILLAQIICFSSIKSSSRVVHAINMKRSNHCAK